MAGITEELKFTLPHEAGTYQIRQHRPRIPRQTKALLSINVEATSGTQVENIDAFALSKSK